MEFGNIAFELNQVKEEDLEVRLNFVIVAKSTFRVAVALRNHLETCGSYRLVHFSMSDQYIYAAKRHELSVEKQRDLGLKP